MRKNVLYIMVGLPGSGKSTYADWLLEISPPGEMIAISRDGLRDEYFHTRVGLTDRQEAHITSLQHSQIRKALDERGVSVVVHDCNLRMQYRKQLAQIAEDLGVQWIQVDLTHVSLETCLERNAKRDVPVPEEAIRGMYNRYIKANKGAAMALPTVTPRIVPPRREIYAPDLTKKKAIMVDIDGTVALHEGVRGPFETSKYHLDNPNLPVIKLVQEHAYQMGYDIIFCSGRHELHRRVTEEWLYEHVKVPIAGLFMRQNHKNRDDIEKLDLFDQHIRNGPWAVRFALDDRDRVVAAWRSIGITTLQVAEGNF